MSDSLKDDLAESGGSKKKSHLLVYGGIAVGGLVVLLVLVKRGAASSASTDTNGGVNTSQPTIIPAGGDSSSGPDPTTTAALTQIAQNQQTLSDSLTQGLATINQNETANAQALANGMSQGFQTLSAQEAQNAKDAAANTQALANGMTQGLASLSNQESQQYQATQQSISQGIQASLTAISQLVASQNASRQATTTPGPSYNMPPTSTYTPPTQHTIFGATVDIQAARDHFAGNSNINYVDTTNMSASQVRAALQAAGTNGLIVGGEKAGGGVSAEEAQGLGISRVSGQDIQGTRAALQTVQF